jgi:hypothetical protein
LTSGQRRFASALFDSFFERDHGAPINAEDIEEFIPEGLQIEDSQLSCCQSLPNLIPR